MHKLLTLGLASLFLVVTGCQDTNTTGPLAGPNFDEVGDNGDDDGGVATAEAELDELNDSGIEGEVEFTSDGKTLTIVGEAEGMDPSVTYVSLIYDNGSFATGPIACEPVLGLSNMFVGFWVVDEDGEGTLAGTNPNALGQFRTISIRTAPGPQNVAACGVVETDDEDDEDDDDDDG